jgi:hypothetical protein
MGSKKLLNFLEFRIHKGSKFINVWARGEKLGVISEEGGEKRRCFRQVVDVEKE